MLLILLLSLLPLSAAQSSSPLPTTLSIAPLKDPAPLVPGGAAIRVDVTVTYEAQGPTPTTAPTRVTLLVGAIPSWLNITVEPPALDFPLSGCACASQKAERIVTLRLVAAPDAPGLQIVHFGLDATAAANAPYAEAKTQVLSQVETQAVVRMSLVALPALVRPDDGGAFVDLRAWNRGNVDSTLHFELGESPAGVARVPPSAVLVTPNATKSERWSIDREPGVPLQAGRLVLHVTASPSNATTPVVKLPDVVIQVETSVAPSSDRSTPAPGILLALVAVGTAMVARAWRRRGEAP